MRTNFGMQDQYITLVKGDTLSFGVAIEDQNGAPLDIETAFFTCKKNLTDEAVFQKSMGNGITKAGDGEYIVRVAPEDTANLEAGRYFYDFQVGLDSDVFTIMIGFLELDHNVTEEG